MHRSFRKIIAAGCIASLLAVSTNALAITVPASASAADITAAMSKNSAAWHDSPPSVQAQLNADNIALGQQLAQLTGGTASYNPATGTHTITSAGGGVALQSGACNSTPGAGVTTNYSSYTGIPVQNYNQFDAAALAAAMAAGATSADIQNAYNGAGDRVAQTKNYSEDALSTAEKEVNVAKIVLGLSDREAAELQQKLVAGKAAYEPLYEQWKTLRNTNPTAAAELYSQMQEINAQQEAIRAEYGYSANMDGHSDGGGVNILDSAYASTIGYVVGGGTGTYTLHDPVHYEPIPGTTRPGDYNTDTGVYEPVNGTFTLTVSSGSGGTISPNGTITVNKGSSKTFAITPDENYALDTLKVDGSAVTVSGNTYTLSNIQAAHTIRATFKQASKFDVDFDDGTPVTDRNGNDLTARNASIKSGYGVFLHIPVSEMVNLEEAPKATMKATFFKNKNAEHELVFVSNGSSGYFELPVNPESPTDAKCAYIPVGTKDKKYDITITVTAKGVDDKNYSFTHTYTIEVKGSMYDDVQFS